MVVEVAEAEGQEAEEAGVGAKENVSAQITMMIIAPLQMMNIWLAHPLKFKCLFAFKFY